MASCNLGPQVLVIVVVDRPGNRRPRLLEYENTLDGVTLQFLWNTMRRDQEKRSNFNTLPETGSKIAGSVPKNVMVAEPGLVSIAPGNSITITDPVSVCLGEDTKRGPKRFGNSRTRKYQQSCTASGQRVRCTSSSQEVRRVHWMVGGRAREGKSWMVIQSMWMEWQSTGGCTRGMQGVLEGAWYGRRAIAH
jgi:hypothetical protein